MRQKLTQETLILTGLGHAWLCRRYAVPTTRLCTALLLLIVGMQFDNCSVTFAVKKRCK